METNHFTDSDSAGGYEAEILDICLFGAKEYTEEVVGINDKLEYKLPFLRNKNSFDNFVGKYTKNWLKALSEPKTNPRSILPNLLPIFFTLLRSRENDLNDIITPIPEPFYKSPLDANNKIYYFPDRLYVLFTAVNNFYEPNELPEGKSIVKPWVEEFKRCYEKYGLPEFYETLWQKSKMEKEEDWLDTLMPPVKELPPRFNHKDFYRTLVIHGEKASQGLFEKVLGEFKALNATTTDYNPLDVRLVNIAKQIHPEMVKRLGYKNGQSVPGYVFRIQTTSVYLGTDKAKMAIDLVMPIVNKGVTEDTPSLLIIERPEKQYWIARNRRYVLQRRMVEKAIRERAGFNVLRYKAFTDMYSLPPKSPQDFAAFYQEKIEPFYDANYYPLVMSRWALADTEEYAFKDWDKGGQLSFTEFVNREY